MTGDFFERSEICIFYLGQSNCRNFFLTESKLCNRNTDKRLFCYPAGSLACESPVQKPLILIDPFRTVEKARNG